ncbi:MAG: glutamate--tRNA ligase [Candidatus Andersenbacteria bacterium]
MNSTPSVRVRIAPSPTGNLHVGTARTALFNELYARKHGGSFVIRIEDTDKERSRKEYEEAIMEALTWLGLVWQEGPDKGGEYGPYRQSERTSLHKEVLLKLVQSGKAYVCYCAPKEKGERETHTCDCSATPGEINAAKRYVIRLHVEPQEVSFTDIIRGEVRVHTDSFGGDFVIARSVDDPLFHLAVVVDDALMKITHVIRGEDHLHNAIKHILIQRACGYEQPQYAHMPLLLDEQRRKLSKRAGETNLLAYRDMGYLPQAMLNYLALLGWAPKDNREIFSHEELVEAFSLERVQKGGAIFSVTKLNSINRHYLSQLSDEAFVEWAMKYFASQGTSDDTGQLQKAVLTERERASSYADISESLGWALPDWEPVYPVESLVWKKSTPPQTLELLRKTHEMIQGMDEEDFSVSVLQERIMEWIDTNELGRGDTLWPLRFALTSQQYSAGPFEITAALGKNETLKRLQSAITKLEDANLS